MKHEMLVYIEEVRKLVCLTLQSMLLYGTTNC